MITPLDPEVFFRETTRKKALTPYEQILSKYGVLFEFDSVSNSLVAPSYSCYRNAFSRADTFFKYCEGFVSVIGRPYPSFHAWCFNNYSDIEDSILGETSLEYFGLVFNKDALRQYENQIAKYGVVHLVSQFPEEEQYKILLEAIISPL